MTHGLALALLAATALPATAAPQHIAFGTAGGYTYEQAFAEFGFTQTQWGSSTNPQQVQAFSVAGVPYGPYFRSAVLAVADYRYLPSPYAVAGVEITTWSDVGWIGSHTFRIAYEDMATQPGAGYAVLNVELPQWTSWFYIQNYSRPGAAVTPTSVDVYSGHFYLVPEPASIALFGAGLAALMGLRRRSQR